jgi:ATP-dependent Lon protease
MENRSSSRWREAANGTVGMYRIEVSVSAGSGKLRMAGGVSGITKESINRAFSYMLAKKGEMSIAREFDVSDLHVEVIDLMNNRAEGEIGLSFFIAAFSALKKAPPVPAMIVLGDLSVQGNIKGCGRSSSHCRSRWTTGPSAHSSHWKTNGTSWKWAGDIVEHVNPIFFGDPKTAAFKATILSQLACLGV